LRNEFSSLNQVNEIVISLYKCPGISGHCVKLPVTFLLKNAP
jgi:hypothetical protein